MLAAFTQSEFMTITKDEADKLSNATGNVLRHYDVPNVAPVAIDWTNLVMVLGMVYGTRIAAAMKANRPAPRVVNEDAPHQPHVVVPMPPLRGNPAQPNAQNPRGPQPPDPSAGRRATVEGIGDIEIPGFGTPRQ